MWLVLRTNKLNVMYDVISLSQRIYFNIKTRGGIAMWEWLECNYPNCFDLQIYNYLRSCTV